MKKTEIITVTYKVELTEEEQVKFNKIPYGWGSRREGTDVPFLSDIRWNLANAWKGCEVLYLDEKEYKALVEYLNK